MAAAAYGGCNQISVVLCDRFR